MLVVQLVVLKSIRMMNGEACAKIVSLHSKQQQYVLNLHGYTPRDSRIYYISDYGDVNELAIG